MDVISDTLVEEVLQETESWSRQEALRMIKRIDKRQAPLLALVGAFTEDLSLEANGLALYLLAMIERMFSKAAVRVRRAKPREIEEAYERNVAFLSRFVSADEPFLKSVASSMDNPQPFVMNYLVETLMEAPTQEKPIMLSEDETGEIFTVLKTVIDVLDRVSQPRRVSLSGAGDPSAGQP